MCRWNRLKSVPSKVKDLEREKSRSAGTKTRQTGPMGRWPAYLYWASDLFFFARNLDRSDTSFPWSSIVRG